MIRAEKYKYCRYSTGNSNEPFFDLVSDPGKMVNLMDDPSYFKLIQDHHDLLKDWIRQINDQSAELLLLNYGLNNIKY